MQTETDPRPCSPGPLPPRPTVSPGFPGASSFPAPPSGTTVALGGLRQVGDKYPQRQGAAGNLPPPVQIPTRPGPQLRADNRAHGLDAQSGPPHPPFPAVPRADGWGSAFRWSEGQGTGTDRGAGEMHAAESPRPHLCGAPGRPPPAAAAPRGPPPRAWPGRAPVPLSCSLRVRPSRGACTATAPRP